MSVVVHSSSSSMPSSREQALMSKSWIELIISSVATAIGMVRE